MGGWEFLNSFSTEEYSDFHDIGVIILSSTIDPEDLAKAKKYPMVIDFLSKPISASELEEVLEDLSNLNDSILYAERIQKSFFPQSAEITTCFGDNIYVNRPKDVISGDFCFFQHTKIIFLFI